MFEMIKRHFSNQSKPSTIILPIKDPSDYTLTPSSTEWDTHTYCPYCKKETHHYERMSDICNGCGAVGAFAGAMMTYRAARKIWNGDRWQQQFRYKSGDVVTEINGK